MLSNGSAASQWVWTISYHYHEDRKPNIGNEADASQACPEPSPSGARVHRCAWLRAYPKRRHEGDLLTPAGCTEALLAAENIPADILLELVQSGLVIARNERLEDEDGAVETTRVWITEAGERAGGAQGGRRRT
jgi:hypothetical protein